MNWFVVVDSIVNLASIFGQAYGFIIVGTHLDKFLDLNSVLVWNSWILVFQTTDTFNVRIQTDYSDRELISHGHIYVNVNNYGTPRTYNYETPQNTIVHLHLYSQIFVSFYTRSRPIKLFFAFSIFVCLKKIVRICPPNQLFSTFAISV